MKKYELIENYLVKFLKDEVYKTGLKNTVIGLSGGVDSAVVAILAKRAFGEKILAVMLPSANSSQSSFDHAYELCEKFSIKNTSIHIGDLVKSYFKNIQVSNLRVGNFSSRMRMSILYDISAKNLALVLGTSNKSELLLGYGTIFGDLASAINPIGDMYKTEIFEFAEHLGVTQSIINKPPSADLWEGQSDEQDLGFTYRELDLALKAFVDEKMSQDELIEKKFDTKLVELITSRIRQNQFKRELSIIAKLEGKAFKT
ncbi:MAG: NAD+ synthase [Sulfurospirillum sp.]|nr:NAD+ synthase [Sulfurospirillum sp.]